MWIKKSDKLREMDVTDMAKLKETAKFIKYVLPKTQFKNLKRVIE